MMSQTTVAAAPRAHARAGRGRTVARRPNARTAAVAERASRRATLTSRARATRR